MRHVARGAFLVAAVVLTLGGYRDALALLAEKLRK